MKITLTDMTHNECGLWVEQMWTTARRVQRIRNNRELAEECGISSTTYSRRAKEHSLPELGLWAVLKLIRLAGYELILTRREKNEW